MTLLPTPGNPMTTPLESARLLLGRTHGRQDEERCLTRAASIAAAIDGYEARIAALEAERDELRLVLAAEQGRAEGAPSSRWLYSFSNGTWNASVPGAHLRAWKSWMRGGGVPDRYEWGWECWHHDDDRREGRAPTARAAMIDADAAIGGAS